uniref:Uncharacterized protein n=1 Tax=Daucus carota subsp. sativus TaxID=79200 RepID=A0A161ZNJ6_DAUCS
MSNPPTSGAGAGNTATPRVYSANQAVGKSPIHHFTSYRQPQQQQQPVVAHHNYPNIAPRVPPPQGMMYPLGSSGGRGFMPRLPYGNPGRVPYGMHIIRPTPMQQQQQQQHSNINNNNHNHNLGVGAGVVRGIPVVSHPKVSASPSSIPDRNGYKDPRPLPIPVGDAQNSKKEDSETEEEDKRDVEQLTSKELLQTHIKRAKRVRARCCNIELY